MRLGKKIRILVADDHYIVRIGLVSLVNTAGDIEVVAEAADGSQAIELYEKHQPDLVLMDLRMTVKTGIEATIEIRRKHPKARVLVLSAFDGDADIRKAFEAGAQGYVLKSSTGEKLIPAIRAVAAGERWIPREVAHRLSSRNSYETLTTRELEVLNQIAKGLANKQIASHLGISEYTVKDHLKSILAKLRVADRTEAVSVSAQRGIIQL
ncbi:MAG: two component transcriptional regulator, LuxR family [Pedosphaera sp.]|jgi:DNA-binding NarL/FixJ family response regulator|nr:two component transcriptional regulator, LuxR family [Pedosphaera sp.]